MALGQYVETPTFAFPLTAGNSLGQYLRVIMSGGSLTLAGATDREIGTVTVNYPSSGSGSMPYATIVLPSAEGAPWFVAAGAISQFTNVYGAANGQVSATPNGNLIGMAMTATANAGEYVAVLRSKQGSEYLYSSLAASAALTNTTTPTDYGLDFTVPANLLKAGDILKISAQGIVTGVASTPTLTNILYLGTQALITTGAVTVAANGLFRIDAEVVIQTGGSGGTMGASGYWVEGVPGTAVPTPWQLATTTALNTTIANLIKVTGTWSAASASNTAVLNTLSVIRFGS
jgi:hypothetical protein